MGRVRLSKTELRMILARVREFYKDPENMREYEAWLEERRKKQAAKAAEEEAAS